MQETLEKLIELILSLSPEVWEIMMRQAYVEILYNIFWTAIHASIMIASIRSIKKISNDYKDDKYVLDEDFVSAILLILLYCAAVIAFIGIGINVGDSIGIAINPEYKAIELLLDFAKPNMP